MKVLPNTASMTGARIEGHKANFAYKVLRCTLWYTASRFLETENNACQTGYFTAALLNVVADSVASATPEFGQHSVCALSVLSELMITK